MIIPPWAYAAAGVATFATGFGVAWTVQGWRSDAAVLAGMKLAAKKTAELMVRTQGQASAYEQERPDAQADNRDRLSTVREIYRTIEVPGACAVPDVARGVLEGAVARANSRAAGEPGAAVPGAAAPAGAADRP
jgi:hypothetical protein